MREADSRFIYSPMQFLRSLILLIVFCASPVAYGQAEDIAALAQRLRDLSGALRAEPDGKAPDMQPLAAFSPEAARERIQIMERLANLDPEAVAASAFSAADIERLTSAGLPVEQLDEHQTTIGVVVRDDFENGRATYEIQLQDTNETAFASALRVRGLACGDRARLRLLRAGKQRVVLRADLVAAAETPACPTTGEQRVAVILMHRHGSPVPATSAGYWQDRIFAPAHGSLTSFVGESSQGKASVHGQVFGWYEAPEPYACSDIIKVKNLAMAAASGDIDYLSYTRILIIAEASDSETCGASGFGQLGCIHQTTPQGLHTYSISWLFARGLQETDPVTPARPTVIHEFGHNLGLHHARSLDFEDEVLGATASTGLRGEYGDQYSMMGGEGDISARHKRFIGWLEEGADIREVNASGDYTLSPLQSVGPFPRALKVQRSPGSTEWIWLESRIRTPWERPPGAPAFEDVSLGVFLHYENQWDVPSERYTDRLRMDFVREDPRLLRPKLKPGEVWRDNHGPLRIEVTGQSAAATEVRVDYEASCAVVATPGGAVPAEGGTVTISVQAPPECSWSAVATEDFVTRHGPTERSGPGTVDFVFAPQPDIYERKAHLTVGRQVFQVTQEGVAVAPRVTHLDLLNLGVDFLTPAGFQVLLEDPNGVQNLDTLEMRIGTSPVQPVCMATVQFRKRRVVMYGMDNVTPISSFSLDNQEEVPGSFCDFGLIGWQDADYAANRPELAMSFYFKPLPISVIVQSIAAAFYVRVQDLDGNQSGWQRMTPFSIGEECIVRTPGARLVLDAGERTVSLPVHAPQGCMWSAYAWLAPMAIDTGWKAGTQMLDIQVGLPPGTPFTAPFEVGTREKQMVRVNEAAEAPVFPSAESVVDGASFRAPVAAGSWFSIFGEHLALVSHAWEGQDFQGYLLPPGLDAVEVLVNGEAVPVAYSSSGQINALMPFSAAGTQAAIKIRTPFGESAEHAVPVAEVAPSLFTLDYGEVKMAAAHHPDGSPLGPRFSGEVGARPAAPGDVVSLYGTGFGPTEPAVPDDRIYSGAAPLKDPSQVQVTAGGQPCTVEFIGKSAAGLYQLNIRIPDLPPGNHEIRLTIGGEASQDGVHIPVATPSPEN